MGTARLGTEMSSNPSFAEHAIQFNEHSTVFDDVLQNFGAHNRVERA